MKKLSLYMGILLIIITTTLDVMFPFVVPYSKSNLALISLMSLLGYFGAYLYIDSYLDRHAYHHYKKGVDDTLEDLDKDDRVI
jgi:hypothetical protein